MTEAQKQGGEAFTLEADVILHAVCSDLASPTEKEGKLCPGLMRSDAHSNATDIAVFLKDSPDFDSTAPIRFEKEYLLDSRKMENHHMGHQKDNGSYVSNVNQFHISNDKGVVDVSPCTSTPKQNAGIDQNCLHGQNGIRENHHQAGNETNFSKQAKEGEDGHVPVGKESSVQAQCQKRNTSASSSSPLGPLTAVPDSHCTSSGTQPVVGGLADPFTPGPDTADPPTYAALYGHSGLKGNLGHEKGEQPPEAVRPKTDPDLVIEVGGQRINAHKSVLAAKSDYFRARLSRDILKVKGVNYKTLSVLIEYIYTSKMNVCKDNVVDVITGAKILQIPCAVQAAMDSMSDQISAQNCYEILTIAKKQRFSELKETAYGFMSDNFLQVLKDPSVYGRLTGSERDLILRKRMEGKKALMVAEINDVFDRVGSRPPSRCNSRPQSPLSVASFEDNHMIYYFNETANDWRPLTSMPEDVNTKGCGICTMYNYLFVAGGIRSVGEKGKVSDKVFCYNPITNRWSEVRPMIQARSQLKLVSMDGNLYAIGGECLFTVEKYDPRMDRWTTVAPLPKGAFAVAHEATTCNGELYVSGGSLFYRLLKYDPKRDEWQECPYNNSRKKSTDMVALKSFLYRFDVNREQGINVFKYNTIVKMWHDCASQRLGSALPFRCAVMGNCVFCVNKTQTLQFIVGEENGFFVDEPLRAPLEAKGVLFPFVLSMPEKPERVV